jgi:hypothetical protein
MCCGSTEALNLPAEVIETLAHYRRLLGDRGWDWGDDQVDTFWWARFSHLGPLLEEFATSGDWAQAIRSVIARGLPTGCVAVRIDERRRLRADVGSPRIGIPGHMVAVDVVIDSAAETDLNLTIAGHEVRVAPRGAAVSTVDVDGADPLFTLILDDAALSVEGVVRTAAAAELHLSAPSCARWSVTDASGGAWFPEGMLRKWDFHHRPFFHGHDVTLAIPAEPLRVVCARGLEFDRTELDVHPAADAGHLVECEPQRLFDPAADGWYGGDLHIHMNYSGDQVCTPSDAARMQRGEGLQLANYLSANSQTSLVYDRDMLEQFADTDLPWSIGDTVARMGVEYRNDLLGHVHALGPSAPPTRFYTGHERSDHPDDWPPNKVACEELRGLGATIGYCHPAWEPFPDDWSTDQFFRRPRSVEARELIADAALGVVDSIDLISPSNDEGALFLYYRLLSCGLRLAATAGTDTFLSFSRLGTASNPPGWGRVYAQLNGRALSVAAFKDAIRAGRTVVTNGPWISLEVNGQGPGAVLNLTTDDLLSVRAQVRGRGAERLTLVGPDGAMAEGDAAAELRLTTRVANGPLWLAAVARGSGDPNTLDRSVLAHTSPVYVDLGGQRVRRRADARWCLTLLDTFEQFIDRHGHFGQATRTRQLRDFAALLDQARSFYRRVAESATR